MNIAVIRQKLSEVGISTNTGIKMVWKKYIEVYGEKSMLLEKRSKKGIFFFSSRQLSKCERCVPIIRLIIKKYN